MLKMVLGVGLVVFDGGMVDVVVVVVEVLVEVGMVMEVNMGVIMIMIHHNELQQQIQSANRTTSSKRSPSELDLPTKQNPSKEKVLGARRVWGTLRICTADTVHSAIKRFCGFDSVRVRKYKDMSNGSERWWFVLDEESVFCAFEEKWNLVEIHNCWKLESCFKPTVSVHSPAAVVSVDTTSAASVMPAPLQPQDNVETRCVSVLYVPVQSVLIYVPVSYNFNSL